MYVLVVALAWPCEADSVPLDAVPVEGAVAAPEVQPIVWIGDGVDMTLGSFQLQLVGPAGAVSFGTEELLWEESPYDKHWLVVVHPEAELDAGEHTLTVRRSEASEALERRFTVDAAAKAPVREGSRIQVLTQEPASKGECAWDDATAYTLRLTPGYAETAATGALHVFRTDGHQAAYTLGLPLPGEATELTIEREAGGGDCFYVLDVQSGLEQAKPTSIACYEPPDSGEPVDTAGQADTAATGDTAARPDSGNSDSGSSDSGSSDSGSSDSGDTGSGRGSGDYCLSPPEHCGCGGGGGLALWPLALLALRPQEGHDPREEPDTTR